MRIRKVPRAWLDDPGSISTGDPGQRIGPSVGAVRNETIVRTVLEAFRQDDTDTLRQFVAPDARLHVAEPCEGPGDFLGAQGVTERFARSAELLGPDATIHINDVLASDSHAAVLFEVRDRGTMGSCARRVAVYRLSRGRIMEIRVHQEPSGALNA
ncbi:MAG: nuclear transport factor 2 family protein [Chloroflexota bacterium]|nr:nuclear transport factor 2 family protein [Chloroflexota bacterium]